MNLLSRARVSGFHGGAGGTQSRHDLHRLRLADAADAGLGLLFAATLAAEADNVAAYHGNWLFDGMVGVIVCVAALLRRFSQVRAAAAAFAVSGAAAAAAGLWQLPGQPGIAATVALFVLTGSAVRVLPVRPAAAIAAGGAAVGVVAMNSHPAAVAPLGLGWGVALGAGVGLRLLDVRRQATIETVRHGERLELARELHDATAHHITGIVLQAQAARIAARKHAETLDSSLAGIEAVGADALSSMRQVIGLLRNTGDAAGLTAHPEDLTDLVNRFAAAAASGRAARAGSAARLLLPNGPADPTWPPEVTTTIYRVVAEALTNVARHAPGARQVTVTLAHDREVITVEVTDDAVGSPVFRHVGGYGLIGMRERVEALGGTLSAGPRSGPAGRCWPRCPRLAGDDHPGAGRRRSGDGPQWTSPHPRRPA